MTNTDNNNQTANNNNNNNNTPKPAVPVTLLSGFLGSGKTTLLKNILQNREGMRVAVIVNEITDENIDAYALGGTKLLKNEEQMVEMANGCICCTLRQDLLKQLRDLAGSGDYDYILIESSGISEPMQVSQTFFIDLNDGLGPLNKVARLDTCVTAVDATTMMDRLRDAELAKGVRLAGGTQGPDANFDKKEVGDDGNPENIGTLMVEQIEYANVVLLNKIDRFTMIDKKMTPEEKEELVNKLVSVVRQLNPQAIVIPTEYSKVDLKQVLGTGKCTIEFSRNVAGWMTDLAENHTPETEEYGVRNFVFRADRPFHPQRFYDWISSMFLIEEAVMDDGEEDEEEGEEEEEEGEEEEEDDQKQSGRRRSREQSEAEDREQGGACVNPALLHKARITRYGGEIFRVKGFVWLGNPARMNFFALISAAGDVMSFSPGGVWDHFPSRNSTGTMEQEPCQRLAFLGQYLDREKMTKDLEGCLLTEEEVTKLKAAGYKNEGGTENNNQEDAAQIEDDEEALLEDIFEDPFEPFGPESNWMPSAGEEDDDDKEDNQEDVAKE